MNSTDYLPSGEWTGFYTQFGSNHRTDMHLTFDDGKLEGAGSDEVGRFVLEGTYDETLDELHWVKTYIGSHITNYRGFRDGNSIWGVWEIPNDDRGGFKIWPRVVGGDLAEGERAKQVEPLAARIVGR